MPGPTSVLRNHVSRFLQREERMGGERRSREEGRLNEPLFPKLFPDKREHIDRRRWDRDRSCRTDSQPPVHDRSNTSCVPSRCNGGGEGLGRRGWEP